LRMWWFSFLEDINDESDDQIDILVEEEVGV
jgi:hypothetical protein